MYLYFKRILDVIISILMLVVLFPFLLIVAALIKLESKGPVIFKQERIGLNGKVFNIYKLRSMCVGAEKMGSGQYSFKGDSRITRIGKVIRALSIDELPQLINIIKGDMSLIGPRPVLTYHPWRFEEYSEEQKKRFAVRPGVTGLAQINGRKTLDWNERIKFDVYYTENLSLWLDISIFFKTIVKIICASDNENTKAVIINSEHGEELEKDVKIDVHNQ